MPDNFDIYSWKENFRKLNENTPVSVGLNMDQTDAVYKVLEDNFGEEHMKDMFTLGSLSFYNMMVKGGIAGVFNEETINEDKAAARISKPRFVKDKNNPNLLNVYIDYDLGPGGSSIALGKETMTGQIRRESAATAMQLANKVAKDLEAKYNLEDIDITDLENGKVRIFAVSDDFINGITEETINEDKAAAIRWFGNLKYDYQKGLTSPDLKDPADKIEYKRLVKDFFSKLEVDNKVRPVGLNETKTYKKGDKLKIKLKNGKKFDVVFDSYSRTKGVGMGKFKDGSGEYDIKPFNLDTIVESVNEQPDVLNKIADMFDRKYPHLTFDVNTMVDRIDVRGDQSDLMKFGEELHGEKIFDYEVFHTDDDDRGEIVRIIKSDRINEEKVDRCLRIARREIPQSSAYRSGLIVKCRKGMIWKDKK